MKKLFSQYHLQALMLIIFLCHTDMTKAMKASKIGNTHNEKKVKTLRDILDERNKFLEEQNKASKIGNTHNKKKVKTPMVYVFS